MKKLIRMEDMDPTTIESFRQAIREEMRPVKELAEMTHRKVNTIDTGLKIMSFDVSRIKEQMSIMNEKLDEHTEKLDTLTGEVMVIQQQTKSIYDGIGLGDSRNKREIDEIKGHLGLKPLDPL